MLTHAIEDYLKAIYELHQEHGKVTTSALAERLNLTPGTVTGMLKKLDEARLAVHELYRGVVLTEAGRRIALEVLRHHRLIERYLAEALGVPWDQVHAEAEKWEHVLSDELEERIDARLGYPTTDPHGAPIPDRHGTIAPPDGVRLSEVPAPARVTVVEVSDHNPALLRYLGELGVVPNARMIVVGVGPFNGPVTVRVAEAEHALGRETASFIRVRETTEPT